MAVSLSILSPGAQAAGPSLPPSSVYTLSGKFYACLLGSECSSSRTTPIALKTTGSALHLRVRSIRMSSPKDIEDMYWGLQACNYSASKPPRLAPLCGFLTPLFIGSGCIGLHDSRHRCDSPRRGMQALLFLLGLKQ